MGTLTSLVNHRRLVLCLTEQIVNGLSFRGYRQDMEVNGYKIEPEANLTGAYLGGAYLSDANLSKANLSGTTMPDGTVNP